MPLRIYAPLIFATLEAQVIPFFGEKVDVGKVEHQFTHLRVAATKKQLRERLAQTRAKEIKVAFVGNEQSEKIIRKLGHHQERSD
jgi:hypothetical protein